MEERIKNLALQLHGAKQKKQEVERHIKSVERELLDQKEVSQLLRPLNNEGWMKFWSRCHENRGPLL